MRLEGCITVSRRLDLELALQLLLWAIVSANISLALLDARFVRRRRLLGCEMVLHLRIEHRRLDQNIEFINSAATPRSAITTPIVLGHLMDRRIQFSAPDFSGCPL